MIPLEAEAKVYPNDILIINWRSRFKDEKSHVRLEFYIIEKGTAIGIDNEGILVWRDSGDAILKSKVYLETFSREVLDEYWETQK